MGKQWALRAVLMALAGCEGGPRVASPAQPSSQAQQADLPSPEGFVSTGNAVNANPTGAWRVVNQTLEGRNRRIGTAADFYRDAWPRLGWTLEDASGDARNGPLTLVFTKRSERARLELQDSGREIVVIRLHVEKKD
jgi:hypothetical protein